MLQLHSKRPTFNCFSSQMANPQPNIQQYFHVQCTTPSRLQRRNRSCRQLSRRKLLHWSGQAITTVDSTPPLNLAWDPPTLSCQQTRTRGAWLRAALTTLGKRKVVTMICHNDPMEALTYRSHQKDSQRTSPSLDSIFRHVT